MQSGRPTSKRRKVRSLKSIIPQLENLYACYNKREYVNPDPLQFLYNYPDIRDREIVGMVASALAHSGIKQILGSISKVLDRMGPSPYKFLMQRELPDLKKIFQGFKHLDLSTQSPIIQNVGQAEPHVRRS